MPAAARREHATDPRAERKTHDRERAPAVGLEAVVKYLLEARGDGELVRQKPRPDRRFAGGSRRDRDHVQRDELAAAAACCERIALDVVGLRRERQAPEIVEAAHAPRIEAA